MKTFASVTSVLKKKHIPFEPVEFTDTAVSARTTDTSLHHNYNPDHAIKTLVVTSKNGFMGIVLKGSVRVDPTKLERLIGKWRIATQIEIEKHTGFAPGTVCPLDMDIPMIIDIQAADLPVWSMGAGAIDKGINVHTDQCMQHLKDAKIVDIAVHTDGNVKTWYSKGGSMDAIDQLLTRGVDTIYPNREALESVLRSGKKISLYLGIDPTGDRLHIGHAIALRKLRQFQDLGHRVTLLIADFTGTVGDPTGKKEGRKQLTLKQVHKNAETYLDQASRIIRLTGDNPVQIRNNSEWLAKLSFEDVLRLAGHFTVQQMIERDMFQERMKRGDHIYLHEFLYPLMQGYDSVAMNVDLEIGGTDQTFNMLAGRKLMAQLMNKDKFVLTVPLLTDTKGVKIGKTEGNVIGLTDEPSDFFGKIMSLGDDAIIPCFTLLTDKPIEEIEAMKREISKGANPMGYKKQLAYTLTAQFNDDAAARKAQENFEKRFQKGVIDVTVSVPTIKLTAVVNNPSIIDILTEAHIAKSKSDARRLIEQHAVRINRATVTNPKDTPELKPGDIVEVGRKAVKII